MLIRKKITALILVLVSVIFLLPTAILAQSADFGSDTLSGLSTASTRDIFEIVTGIVNLVLYFLGAIAVLLFTYAGWLWFTSRGSRDRIDRAKKIMVSAVIGLLIIFSSYAIVNWLFHDAIQRAFYGSSGSGNPTYGGGVGLGGGVIDSHYPESNATGVPRNTNIYITFKEPMQVDTIASGTGCSTNGSERTCPINTNNIRLHKTSEPAVNLADMTVTYNSSNPSVFEFNPYGTASTGTYLLGEQTSDTKYEMSLVNLRTASGRQAFNFNSYSWRFTVGTYSDNTAPRVVSVRPANGTTAPRNTVVQINFSEAVNPTLATGLVPGYDNIKLVYQDAAGADHQDAGSYVISNQYRTVEFIPSERCGQNSCGLDVFCMTAEDFIGTVTTNIKDVAGNPLASNYTWNFSTSNDIDTTPPKLVGMGAINNVSVTAPVQMTFDKTLLSSSIKSPNIQLFQNTAVLTPINYWFRLGDANGLDHNVVNIYHERFDVSTSYLATSTSAIMDEHQNCWYPCRCDDPTGRTCICNTPGATCAADGSNCVAP